ncbi:uncharacterized protein LOC124369322 [Homalodisca vitripennis]|uniref:uncharacterized protein LOC124369322 n=1 Tax=Homalodisca vitripennis TaxID=197043 RepID=UPI001EEAAD01|nr:uncharacterized protein LOC124369322 [Homalodisca vitripennis]
MREVLGSSSPFCSIPEEAIKRHFEASYSSRDGCAGVPPPNCLVPPALHPPPLLDSALPEEVSLLLRRASNTAPGPDGVRYNVWRRRDPTGHVLAAVFNLCIAARRFPPSWKSSSTVLIHKKDNPGDINNWRPIALSNTAGKLLCSLLADRLSRWASDNNLISGAQKGFTPAEGCLEHNFILQELLDDARRRGSELCVAWFDLANAFGSVPHSALLAALRSAGLSQDQLRFIEDLYQGSSTSIRHSRGSTDPIAFGAGVRQGCPLSPILFNLVMEYLIRPLTALEDQHGAVLHGTSVSVLAYADDLALVARSEASLQALLDVVIPAATWVGLRFKPTKCATLHVARRTTRPSVFRIYGAPLRVLGEGDSYQHLGVPTGMKVDQTPVATIARLEAETEAVLRSVLAPWQKLHALRTFIIPQLEFNLKTARIRKTALRSLDSKIKCGMKKIFNVPSRASAELVYLPPSCGGAGLVPLADLSDLAAINHAFRLLTSPDARVASLALEGLAASAGQRSAARAGMEFLVGYLNGDFPGNSNVATTFSAARAALNRLKKRLPDLRWGWCAGRATFQITIPGDRALRIVDRGSRHALSASLRSSLQQHFRATLSAKPDQGRVARVTTTCATANHMLHEGRYTRFADWRFVHRARLNVLPLNGCRRWGVNDRRCRRCGQHDETTAHVLCHCTSSLATGITRRHNAVQDLLVAAIRPAEGVEVRVNQRVPLQALLQGRDDFPEEMVRCRPDVVMIDAHNKIVKIVDIAVPYEDGWRAIEAARERKLDTYGPLARMLTAGGYRTSVDAFIVGSLGAWDSANWGTLARLGVHRRYGTSLSRRCVSEAIRWSRDIYVTHVSGVQQWQD